jgi:hypothetical protein
MAVQFEHINGDDRRRRLLDAADRLVAALEDARHSSELRHIGGDLAQLQNDVTRMRRAVEHQPTQGFEFWG